LIIRTQWGMSEIVRNKFVPTRLEKELAIKQYQSG